MPYRKAGKSIFEEIGAPSAVFGFGERMRRISNGISGKNVLIPTGCATRFQQASDVARIGI
jgi:hypothetical protein